jgi:hypothetical protein
MIMLARLTSILLLTAALATAQPVEAQAQTAQTASACVRIAKELLPLVEPLWKGGRAAYNYFSSHEPAVLTDADIQKIARDHGMTVCQLRQQLEQMDDRD